MDRKALFVLIFILFIASFFRLWKINEIPPGLYPDVAINGNEALESLKTGNFKLFYPENNGREGLMMWLIALSFSIFGVSIWSIKIVAAIIGIFTVLGLYLLNKELFNNPTIQQSNNYRSNLEFLFGYFFLAHQFLSNRFPSNFASFCFSFCFLFFTKRIKK